MRIGVLTSLYPSPPRPQEGIFAERRWVGMRERGHEVFLVHPVPHAPRLLAWGERGEYRRMPSGEERRGVRIGRPRYRHLPRRALGNAAAFASAGCELLLGAERPEVVVLDYAWPAAAAVQRLHEAGLPCVVNGRGSDVLQVRENASLRAELARSLERAGRWCAVSLDLVRAMDELAGQPGRGVLVPNGVDLDLFRVQSKATVRRELGMDVDAPHVLVVGHLIERKDPLLALAAFAAGAPPDARLSFVGRGPLQGALERAIRAGGLGERVELLGELAPAELRPRYAATDLLLLTSKREGRPNVVLEALASGRGVLATQAGGTAELLEGRPEFLAEGRDALALGASLAQLLADPPAASELRAMAEAYTWDASCSALEALLQESVA